MSSPQLDGHLCSLSRDPAARGGSVLRCLRSACGLRLEGTEAELTGRALDHFDETLLARHAR